MGKDDRGKRGKRGHTGPPGPKGICMTDTIEYNTITKNFHESVLTESKTTEYEFDMRGSKPVTGFKKTIVNFVNNDKYKKLLSGVNGDVFTIVHSVTDNLLYVGGDFTMAGTVSANNIAIYSIDNNTWYNIGAGLNNTVRTIVISPDNSYVYIGGDFTYSYNDPQVLLYGITKYNPLVTTFYPLNVGTIGFSLTNGVASIYSLYIDILTVDEIVLYIGGDFDAYDDGILTMTINNIAKWNLSYVQAVGDGLNEKVLAITGTSDHTIYIGGTFTSTVTNSISMSYISVLKNGVLTSIPCGSNNGANNYVYTLTTDGTNIYAGGKFDTVYYTTVDNSGDDVYNTLLTKNVAKYDGSIWTNLQGGVGSSISSVSTVYALFYDMEKEQLHVGGIFGKILSINTTVQGYAMYDIITNNWFSMDIQLYNINYITMVNNILYIGGVFTKYVEQDLTTNIIGINQSSYIKIKCDNICNNIEYEDMYLTARGQVLNLYYGGNQNSDKWILEYNGVNP